jgi:hypothetical protein
LLTRSREAAKRNLKFHAARLGLENRRVYRIHF